MTYNAEQYIDLMKESRRHFQERDYKEAQMAYGVAQQYWRDLTSTQRRQARATLEGTE